MFLALVHPVDLHSTVGMGVIMAGLLMPTMVNYQIKVEQNNVWLFYFILLMYVVELFSGYPYDYPSTYNSNYYAYFENLRRTNPAAYAEWYHKYYANHQAQATARAPSNYPDGRASVHSGQSSCDEQ